MSKSPALVFETKSEWVPKMGSLLQRLRKVQRFKSTMYGTNAKASIFVLSWIQRNFASQGSLAGDGIGWVPLKPATIARRRHGKGKTPSVMILQDKGWLKNNWKVDFRPDGFAVQSMVDYGIYHDSDRGPRKRLPQRKIVPRPPQIQKQIQAIYKTYITEILNRA